MQQCSNDQADFSCARGLFRLLFRLLSSIVLLPAVLQAVAGSDRCPAKWGAIVLDSVVHAFLLGMAFAVMREADMNRLRPQERAVAAMAAIATVVRMAGAAINHNRWTSYCRGDFMRLLGIPQTATAIAVVVAGMAGFVLFLVVALHVCLVCKVAQIMTLRLPPAATVVLMVVRILMGLAVGVWSMWAGLANRVDDGGGSLVLHVMDLASQLAGNALLVGDEAVESAAWTTSMLVLLTVSPVVKAVSTYLFYYVFDRHWLCAAVLFPYLVGAALVGLAILAYHIVRFEGTR